MWNPGSRRRLIALLTIVVFAAAAGVGSYEAGALSWLEHGAVDARFSLRGRQAPPRNVVVVGIDNTSLGNLPRFPFSRVLHARLLERLHAAGARLIVYDVSFDRPTSPRADEALFDAAAKAAPVVFATSLISPAGRTEVLGGDANLHRIGDRAAAADLLPDSDGVIRRTLGEVNGLPTVAAVVADELGRRGVARHLNRSWIDFPGPPGTLRNIPFSHVLQGHFNRAAIRGKVVVVGATASVLQDLHRTSAGGAMAGPEVQANVIGTSLAGFPLRDPSVGVTLMLILLLASIGPLTGARLGTLSIALVGAGSLALWSLAAIWIFDAGVVLDYADPLLALALGVMGAALVGLWADRRERTRLRELFAADAGGLVDQVLSPLGSRQLEPTAIIAGYRIEEVVGRGGMGVVYRASQLALERPVAVKLIAPERYHDPSLRERFKRESRVAALIEHANVIPVYEAGEDEGLLFIAMRLVEGSDLAHLLDLEGPLTPARTLRLIGQLAGALDAAHGHGLVHRDVKPANALITSSQPEHLYLTDFGVATHVGVDNGMTQGGFVGTFDYLAPEQIRGGPVDARADTYALTGVLYECLTGEVPFPRDDVSAKLWAQINASPPSPSMLEPSLPTALDEVVACGMAKNPAARFTSAGELAEAFADALGSLDVVDAQDRTDPHEARPAAPSTPTVVSE